MKDYLRTYSKLHVNTNRKEGSEKIILGWEQNIRETVLKKDEETYFHVPVFTEKVSIKDTTLIADGATAGPFPAASDRIFENRKNFENSTPNGSTSQTADGTWFCSWLYKDDYGNVQWMDRFYNPGKIELEDALTSLSATAFFKKHDPIFRDVPSTFTLEPGVMYKYLHVGEGTAGQLLSSFGGLSGEHLRLNLENWGQTQVDTSKYQNKTRIKTSGSLAEIYSTLSENDRVSKKTLNFSNSHKTQCFVEFSSNYNLSDELTLSLWAQSPSWQNSPYTELAGNFSSNGGYGIFIEAFNTYPFLVVPETFYGHLIFINQNGQGIFDKLAKTTNINVKPSLFYINSDYHVIFCNKDNTGTITKIDHQGKVLATTKNPNEPSTLFSFMSNDEIPQQILGAENDAFYIVTNKAYYKFDRDLTLLQSTAWLITANTKAAIKYNIAADTHSFVLKDEVVDVKFLEENEWSISSLDGHLYLNSKLFKQFADEATKLSIAPNGKIWVLHGKNSVTIFDPSLGNVGDNLFTTIGVGTEKLHGTKAIGFLKTYDRTQQTYEWICAIQYADDSQMFFLDLEGNLKSTSNIASFFDYTTLKTYNQNKLNFVFENDGDFTGYETRRIFEKLSPFKGTPQLILKASLKDKTKLDLSYKTFKSYIAIDGWDKQSWQHIVCILQNKQFKLYVNGVQTSAEISYNNLYELSYEQQPLFMIGSPLGSKSDFNEELLQTACIFNGKICDVKVFDYALEANKLDLFIREALIAQDILWSLPIPKMHFIEEIERMFKNKVPGSKGTFFNLKLAGTKIQNPAARAVAEKEIKLMLEEIKPAITELVSIQWID